MNFREVLGGRGARTDLQVQLLQEGKMDLGGRRRQKGRDSQEVQSVQSCLHRRLQTREVQMVLWGPYSPALPVGEQESD